MLFFYFHQGYIFKHRISGKPRQLHVLFMTKKSVYLWTADLSMVAYSCVYFLCCYCCVVCITCVLRVLFHLCLVHRGGLCWRYLLGHLSRFLLKCGVISNLLTIFLHTKCMHKQWLLLLRYKHLEQLHVLFRLTRQVVLSTVNPQKEQDIKLKGQCISKYHSGTSLSKIWGFQ